MVMISKIAALKRLKRVHYRTVKRVRKHAVMAWWVLAVGTVAAACLIIPAMQPQREVDVSQLLNTIAKGESKGNYNAYYGNAGNTEVLFTHMSVREVLAWQERFVQSGHPSSAVGKYQFVRPTLAGLVGELKIDPNQKFDEQLQDRLARRLLERRGLKEYVKGKITREQFAHNLSKEWAALPRVIGDRPEQSYYAGDGLNHVQISIDEIKLGIASLHVPQKPKS